MARGFGQAMGARRRGGQISAFVDLGSSKIATLICQIETGPEGTAAPVIRPLGLSQVRSQGIKAGVITNMAEAEDALRVSVGRAEQAAGVQVETAVVAVSCGRMKSQRFAAHAEVVGQTVSHEDVARAIAGGQAYAARNERLVVHMNPISFRLDGQPCGENPVGLAARRLTVNLHVIAGDPAPLSNVVMLFERAHLRVTSLVPAILAGGIGAITEDERRLGVTVIDLGGGTTSIATFADGELVHVDVMAEGAGQLTLDLARGLQTTLADAERIKALYGSILAVQSHSSDVFSFALAGGGDLATGRASAGEVKDLMLPRLNRLMSRIAELMSASGVGARRDCPVVLTGGGSQLVGLSGFAAECLGRPVRVSSGGSASWDPATEEGRLELDVLAGLPVVTFRNAHGGRTWQTQSGAAEPMPGHYIGRVGRWISTAF